MEPHPERAPERCFGDDHYRSCQGLAVPRREPSTLFGLVTSLLLGFALVLPLAGTDRLWPSIWTVFAVSLVVTALNSGVLAARAKGATRGPSEGKRSK